MKGQGLSINTIIIVALGLLVLIVVATILTGRAGLFARDTQMCVQQGGVCAVTCGEGDALGKPISISADCPVADGVSQMCCIG